MMLVLHNSVAVFYVFVGRKLHFTKTASTLPLGLPTLDEPWCVFIQWCVSVAAMPCQFEVGSYWLTTVTQQFPSEPCINQGSEDGASWAMLWTLVRVPDTFQMLFVQ